MSSPHPVSRREFLKLGGLVVSFAVPVRAAFAAMADPSASQVPAKAVAPDQVGKSRCLQFIQPIRQGGGQQSGQSGGAASHPCR